MLLKYHTAIYSLLIIDLGWFLAQVSDSYKENRWKQFVIFKLLVIFFDHER